MISIQLVPFHALLAGLHLVVGFIANKAQLTVELRLHYWMISKFLTNLCWQSVHGSYDAMSCNIANIKHEGTPEGNENMQYISRKKSAKINTTWAILDD